MWDNPEEVKLNPAVDVCKHYKKNSSILFCIGKIAKSCDHQTVAEKLGQLIAREIGKSQFL